VDVLIVRNPEDMTVTRIGRNLVKAKIVSPVSLNVYDLLNYKNILVDQKALPVIAERYSITK
jgi:ribosomal protein L4